MGLPGKPCAAANCAVHKTRNTIVLSMANDRLAAAKGGTAMQTRIFNRRKTMLKTLCALGAVLGALTSAGAFAQAAPEVTLTRLDCGNGFNDSRRFSDTFAYSDPKIPFTFSCYVIKHGADYMIWDTGYLPG